MTRILPGVAAGILAFLLALVGRADPPAPSKGLTPGAAMKLLGSNSSAALAGNLRAVLLDSLPTPLFEDNRHWGMQKSVRRVEWRGKGLHVHPEPVERMENDGRWWMVKVTAPNPRDALVVDLRDFQQPAEGRMTFTAFFALDTDVEYDRQRWREGARTYSGSVRARMRIKLTLRCEATGRLQTNDFLPEAVVRLRVVQSDLKYDNFVVEHIAGVGGELAKVLGDAAHASINQWRPSLERDFIARANAAILKAGDTREVRVSLGALLGQKTGGILPLAPTPK
jgi:hypothetical protein